MLRYILVAIVLALPVRVMAQDPLAGLNGDGTVLIGELPPDTILPRGKPCEVDGERFQCFTLDEMKELLTFENELRFYETSYPQLFSKVSLLEDENSQLKTQLLSTENQVTVLKGERERIYLKWEEENRLRLKAENKPKFGNPIAWGIAGGEAAAILGLILGMVLH